MGKLPTGTVTLLFTDIEGSTRLLQQIGNAYENVLRTYRSLLRAAFSARGGVEVDTQGDGLFAAFPSARNAVAAAVDAQRHLIEADLGGAEVRVRMGLHTGEPTVTDEGYVGADVHRAARICSAAHGGQVLISDVTADLLSDGFESAELRDLGDHGLKDLSRPQRLFQVAIAGLRNDFPPPRTFGGRPNNLPRQLTSLVGRADDIETASVLLRREDTRLVTLVGPGGTGKTRLAVEVGTELLDAFAQGVFFVDLSPLKDAALVMATIAQTLSVRESGGQPLRATIQEFLAGKEMLLILDNFEQVLDAAPEMPALLASSPRLKVLATSREPLRVRGERELPVPPLSSPQERTGDAGTIAASSSVALFVDRARSVKPGFELTDENAGAVADICRYLDGLPLAIELAAARIRLLPPAALASRLHQSLDVLGGAGPRDLPHRQRTLRGAIEWSYELLTDSERELLSQMSILSGPSSLESIESVCSCEGADVLTVLQSLVDKSLVNRAESSTDDVRFVMLRTITEFAYERLRDRGGADRTRERHAEHFLDVAKRAEEGLAGPGQVAWLQRIDADHDNLHEAIRWSLERGAGDRALRIATALHWFWWIRGQFSTGRHWLGRGLALRGGDPLLRGRALVAYARLVADHGDFDEAKQSVLEAHTIAETHHDDVLIAYSLAELGYVAVRRGEEDAETLTRRALDIFRRLGDPRGEALALMRLATVATRRGDFDGARKMYVRALQLRRSLGDAWGTASALNNLGYDAALQGRFDEARPYLEECRVLFEKVGFKEGIANVTDTLALVAVGRGDLSEAIDLYEQALRIFQEIGYRLGIAFELVHLGRACVEVGDNAKAVDHLRRALELAGEVHDEETKAYAYEGIASLAASTGRLENAATLFAAAERYRVDAEIPLPPVDKPRLERFITRLKDAMDPTAFEAAWNEGARMAAPDLYETALREALALEAVAADAAAHEHRSSVV